MHEQRWEDDVSRTRSGRPLAVLGAAGSVVAAWLCAQVGVAPERPPGDRLRLVSANLLHRSNPLRSKTAGSVAVAEALVALQPDVLLLLEWTGDNADRQTLVDGGLGLYVDRARPGTSGVAVALSGRVRGMALEIREGGVGPCAMPGAAVRVEWAGQEVGVVGVHAPPPLDGCSHATAASLELYAGWVEGGRVASGAPPPLPAGAPVVLMGDLNTLPVHGRFSILRDVGLVDGVLAHSWRPSPSWPSLAIGLALGRIDGIWPPAGAVVEGAGTVAVPDSDHRAVWLDLGTLPGSARY